MDALTFLRDHVSLFAGCAASDLEPLAVAASVTSHASGQTILFKGATVDGLHIVAAGKVSVHVKAGSKPAVKVAELGAGEVFGETSIVEMGTAGATVKSAEDGTYVLMIPQEAFRHLLQRDEAFAVRVNTLIQSRKTAAVPA